MSHLPPVVLFDLDDTLVSFSANGDFWPAAFATHAPKGLRVDSERFCAAITRAADVYWADDARAARGRLDLVRARREVAWLAFVELGLNARALADSIADDFTWRKEHAVAPFEGAVAVLEQLRSRGVRLGLITNGHGDFQRRKLARYALEVHFDTILIEGEFGVGKPHERIFREALRRMDVRPEDVWMVGDNLHADVAGAQACGVYAVWHDYARVGLPKAAGVMPNRIIHHVADLLQP